MEWSYGQYRTNAIFHFFTKVMERRSSFLWVDFLSRVLYRFSCLFVGPAGISCDQKLRSATLQYIAWGFAKSPLQTRPRLLSQRNTMPEKKKKMHIWKIEKVSFETKTQFTEVFCSWLKTLFTQFFSTCSVISNVDQRLKASWEIRLPIFQSHPLTNCSRMAAAELNQHLQKPTQGLKLHPKQKGISLEIGEIRNHNFTIKNLPSSLLRI